MADYEIFLQNESLKDSVGKLIEKERALNLDKSFNMFRAISDKYKKENLHTDMMYCFLGNSKDCFGNEKILKAFLEKIGCNNIFRNYEKVQFVRELPTKSKNKKGNTQKGRIDLAIFDDNNAVIIENKLNDAKDMENQLGKYYKYFCDLGTNVSRIVYLTKYGNERPSNLETYDSNDVDTILNLIKPMSAVEYTNFLKNIKDNYDNNPRIKYFIEDYINSLKEEVKEVEFMSENIEILRCLLENKDNILIAKNITKIWQKKYEVLEELLFNDLSKDQRLSGYEIQTVDGFKVFAKKLPRKNYTVYFASSYDRKELEIGLHRDDKTVSLNDMNSKIKKLESNDIFKLSEIKKDNNWRFRTFTAEDKVLDEIVDGIIRFLVKLERE